MATQRQIEIYKLHKEACQANGHPQTAIYHRHVEGTLTLVGPGGQNTSYTQPDPRSSDNPMDAPVLVWMTWEGLHLRGINQDGGDSISSRMWMERSLIQFPAIDDNSAAVTIQDDDFLFDSTNVRFKIENPVLSADGAWWTAIAVVMR